ncbi:MAG: hypothetical protein ABIT76_07650 [Chthoniobacterales bacterium]
MKKLLYTLALASLFTACEKTTVVPAGDSGKDTTVIVPGAEKKTENNTTIVNPASSEKKTESTTTVSPGGSSSSETKSTTTTP